MTLFLLIIASLVIRVFSIMCRVRSNNIGLDKSEYQINSFLITRRKHVVGTY